MMNTGLLETCRAEINEYIEKSSSYRLLTRIDYPTMAWPINKTLRLFLLSFINIDAGHTSQTQTFCHC